MKLMVMDGQGGGIGATVIKGLRAISADALEVYAVGTNSAATARMMKAGANRGATGENAIIHTSPKVEVIIGPLAIIMANAMMGEVTPSIAAAVAGSRAQKVLLPITQENVQIVGTSADPLPHLVEQLVEVDLKRLLQQEVS